MRGVLWKFSGVAVGLLAVAWAVGLLWFASTIPKDVADTSTHTDAIVALTGGAERIETGVQLLSQGLAERLFVSGAGEDVRTADILGRSTPINPDLAANITIGKAAVDTPGNAIETAEWVRGQNMRSIRLVTAAYHMRRSLMEFHEAMPEVKIVPHAVFPAHVKQDWWRWPGTASLIAREYTKYLATWARQNIDPREPASRPYADPSA
ncbi:MAG: YdcF family protein [Rhodospirillaceae bacterium]